jgi:hypothetical protein
MYLTGQQEFLRLFMSQTVNRIEVKTGEFVFTAA